MQRRSFLKSLAGAGAALTLPRFSEAALPKAKITKVNIYEPPRRNMLFNQSDMVVTVETDAGITGVGEGGAKDTLEQCAGTLIGKNPFHIDAIWQEMYIAWFYPPGREKAHAMGALDLALWDIKGKALGVPLHDLLGGASREFCECYSTSGLPAEVRAGRGGGGTPMSLKDQAKATIDSGYRGFRVDASIGGAIPDNVFNTHERVRLVAQACKEIREGVGPHGDWMIDFHQKFDYADALRCCRLIEEYEPYFVEDPVRDEHFLQDIPRLRQMTTCPLTAGEEWGVRWDFHKLVENHDIDYIRATLPNVGGITEMMKIAALCETHSVGIAPHFTGPISTAALVAVLATFSGPVIMEYNFGGRGISYLPECLDFKAGKAYPNARPGLGVTLDLKQVKQIGSVDQPGRANIYRRPDGSLTHW
ncbi:MAG TPA: enolase C-terminal domain-like protein [Candidatus Acidoferrum sp.]|nr:enolase C-terminal domain-like protein [Candidatus Acidoferrum sp.]